MLVQGIRPEADRSDKVSSTRRPEVAALYQRGGQAQRWLDLVDRRVKLYGSTSRPISNKWFESLELLIKTA